MVGIADYSGSIDDLMRKIEIHLATEGPKTWVEIRTALQVGAFLSEEATDFLSAMVRLKVEERIGVDDSGETILYYVKT